MVKVVNWAIQAYEGEQHVVDSLLVNAAEYDGKQLKTDKRVPRRLRNDEFFIYIVKSSVLTARPLPSSGTGIHNIPLDLLPPETC